MLWCRYHHLHHSDKDTNFCLFMPLFDALGNTLNKKSWQSPKLPSSGSGKLSYDLIMTSSNYSFVHFDFNAWWELNITNSISQKLHLHYVFWCKIKFYHITYQLSLQETVTRYPILFSWHIWLMCHPVCMSNSSFDPLLHCHTQQGSSCSQACPLLF